jgi:hypothetical protein
LAQNQRGPFARQADPALINVHQMRHAQPGSGAINGNRFAFDRFSAAKLNQMLRLQHRDRHRHRGKVIDDFKMRKAEVFFISAMENAQVWLVIATQSPVIGQAMAMQPSSTLT